MLSLSHKQLKLVMAAAHQVPTEKRALLLERLGAMLNLKRRFSDGDLVEAIALASVGLSHKQNAAE
jgi:hypothetical protein